MASVFETLVPKAYALRGATFPPYLTTFGRENPLALRLTANSQDGNGGSGATG